jgi:hypothetical protein
VTDPKLSFPSLASYARDALAIGAAITAIGGFLMWLAVSLFGPVVAEHAKTALGLDQLATHQDIARLEQRVDALSRRLSTLSGDERLVYVDLLRSFVRSPVPPGGQIDAVIYANRTERGKQCLLTTAAIVFETQDGIRIPGPSRPAASQLPDTITRLRFVYPVPDLPPGRTGVWMVGTYECPWGRAVEENGPLIFLMEG